MQKIIASFADGRKLSFGPGKFDNWCVYLEAPGKNKVAPRDVDYFTRLQKLGNKHGYAAIYKDFIKIYERTSAVIEKNTLELIRLLSAQYGRDSLEIEVLYTILYAGMVAEENKENAVLKKRIKRLGMYQVLMEKMKPETAASFSKGVPWRELDEICRKNGF